MDQQLWQQESRFALACFEGLHRYLCCVLIALPDADVNYPYPESFVCRNPYRTLTVHTDGTDFSFPCVNGFVCRNSWLKPTCTTRYLNHSPRIVCIKLPMVARAVFTPSRKTAGSIPFFSTNKKRLCSNILRSHRLSLFPSFRHPQMDTGCDPWYRWRYRSGPRTSLNPTLPARERVWPI